MKSSNLALRLDAFEPELEPVARPDKLRLVERPKASRQRSRFRRRNIVIRDQGFELFRVC